MARPSVITLAILMCLAPSSMGRRVDLNKALMANEGLANDKALVENEDLADEENPHKCPPGLVSTDVGCSRDDLGVEFMTGGVIDIRVMFTGTMADAINDAELVAPIVKEVEGIWENHTEDAASVMERVRELRHKGHQIEEGMPRAAVFIIEHSLEHALIHIVVHGLHEASHALAHGTLHSMSEVAGFLGTVAVGLEVIGQAMTFPGILMLQGLLMYVQAHRAQMKAWGETAKIAVGMKQKHDCLDERVSWSENTFFMGTKAGSFRSGVFKPEVAKICPVASQKQLALELLDANGAMRDFFAAVGYIGQCLYPVGAAKYRTGAKIACIEAIIPALHDSNGKMGLLYSAIGLAIAHTKQADDMFGDGGPRYGSHIESIYSVSFATVESVLPKLVEMTEVSQGMQSLACVTLITTQRAYAAAFRKLTTAVNVWMRTYGREKWLPNIQGVSWHPCREVIHDYVHDANETGMCKQEYYHWPDSRPVSVCTNAYQSRIWDDKKKGH